RNRLPLVEREELDAEHQVAFDAQLAARNYSPRALPGPGGIKLRGSASGHVGDGLGGRLRELIRLVVSREWDQPVEWTLHEPVALKEGLEPYIIDVVRNRGALTGIPEKEAAIIQLGREMFGQHYVSPETFARARHALGNRDLVDMCVVMGDYTETAILLTLADVHLPYGREPALPVP
ncbi:MAG: hypothetical protein V3S34_01670, partial [Hyphomicrobium sp.]